MTALAKLTLRYEVEEFLIREAELLDERQFESWLELLADDIHYFAPLARNRRFGDCDTEYTNEDGDLNWFDEGKFELEQRVKQIMTGQHWCEEPVSRTTHMIANLQVQETEGALVRARCRFVVYRNRNETDTDLWVGKREDQLRREAGSFRIARRRILLDQNVLLAKNLTTFF
jgi:3-phenylpropionate/cinnamic acid dioxygenase small subunit